MCCLPLYELQDKCLFLQVFCSSLPQWGRDVVSNNFLNDSNPECPPPDLKQKTKKCITKWYYINKDITLHDYFRKPL